VILAVAARLQREGFTLEVDLELPLDGVTSLFGRSGCGKTTLLRVVAGLERVPGAEVRFGDQTWQSGRRFLPLHRRRIGMVFQEPSLLAHLSVRDNLLYGYRRTPPELRRLHLPEVAELLGIGELLERPIDRLSGGQRQRVALGRALLTSPQLLLLDEPLAALDTQTKREILPFLSRMASAASVPILLVTHAPDEVERLADRVVFMREGRIEAVESLREALARADSPLFIDEGAVSVLEGSLGPVDARGLCAFGPEDARLWLPGGEPRNGAHPVRVRIRARDVSLALDDPQRISIRNHLPVRIEAIERMPAGSCLARCRMADGQRLLAEVTPWAVEQLGLRPGLEAHALIKSVALMD
jgi:molybdate transport system ATP-binding protein